LRRFLRSSVKQIESIFRERGRVDSAAQEGELRKGTKKAVPPMSIGDLVKDWGGFEKLVAELHETGEVTVEHDAILPGRSGAPRQTDVLIRHKQGLYEHLVVAECKYWNSPVERLHVDALATTVREVGASRGVIFFDERISVRSNHTS
jgi:hypothetical protein